MECKSLHAFRYCASKSGCGARSLFILFNSFLPSCSLQKFPVLIKNSILMGLCQPANSAHCYKCAKRHTCDSQHWPRVRAHSLQAHTGSALVGGQLDTAPCPMEVPGSRMVSQGGEAFQCREQREGIVGGKRGTGRAEMAASPTAISWSLPSMRDLAHTSSNLFLLNI